jgi:protein arginine N-methyltransferase 1
VYSLRDYGEMIGDDARVASYVEALRRVVKPGAVVLDIGTGTGILAMLACRFGARRVFAVEPGDVIELAREFAAANGFAERIEFIQGVSTAVELPERADVIVAEIHGILPLFEKSIVTLIDARTRLLAPGGTMIPARETIWASVVHAPALYSRIVGPWGDNPLGVDLALGRRHAASQIYGAKFAAGDLLCAPAKWASLDYAAIETPDVTARVSLGVTQGAIAHGIGLWFDSTLADGVEMSNAPGRPPLIFGHAFFPWPEPVSLAPGDRVEVEIGAKLLGERYLWRWESRIASAGRERAAFRQSQFQGAIIVPEKLRRQAASHRPLLNEAGEIERFVLDRIAGRRALGEIAGELRERFPARFARFEDALNHVGDLALRLSD